jgi:hypothetical protein
VAQIGKQCRHCSEFVLFGLLVKSVGTQFAFPSTVGYIPHVPCEILHSNFLPFYATRSKKFLQFSVEMTFPSSVDVKRPQIATPKFEILESQIL